MTSDKYATAEAYYGLARAYSNVPDLHIMWLLYLCEVHQGNQSYAEAAQCAVAVAGVIMQVHIVLCSTVQHRFLHIVFQGICLDVYFAVFMECGFCLQVLHIQPQSRKFY